VIARLVVGASVLIAVVAVAVAATRGDASYTEADAMSAFAQQGYALETIDGGRWTRGAPASPGTFLFPKPIRTAPFYVYVAPNNLLAHQFIEALGEPVPGDGSFDVSRGNVVVSSDSSLTPIGLTREERRRIRAAIGALDGT
jgi:hypothetical protein